MRCIIGWSTLQSGRHAVQTPGSANAAAALADVDTNIMEALLVRRLENQEKAAAQLPSTERDEILRELGTRRDALVHASSGATVSLRLSYGAR